ncbi:MAG: ATP-binding protein [Thermoguttaceae bacterium]
MKTDILGRLMKIPLSVEKPLMPLFEAITNSIQSITEAKSKDGKITVLIHRSDNSFSLSKDIKVIPPVVGFSITDNGIGFNDANYDSCS